MRHAGNDRSSRPLARSIAGLTLIEVLIALAVAGILTTVAYPAYTAYKVRANRAAAQALLIELANRQQLYLLDARSYATTLSDLGAALPPEVASYYLISDPVVDNTAGPPSFVVSASARAGTVQARDGDLSINSEGIRSGHW